MASRRPPRPSPRRDTRSPTRPKPFEGKGLKPRSRGVLVGLSVGSLVILAVVAWWLFERERPRGWLVQAEAASKAADWSTAVELWSRFNATSGASGESLLAEARAALAVHRASQAGRALRRACVLDPARSEPWRLRLDLLRVLDRPTEALRLAREAERAVADRLAFRPILVSATLGVLAEVPDDEARDRLERWLKADPEDVDARVALLARAGSNPHPGDLDRAGRIAELLKWVERYPDHAAARDALLIALADVGEPELGREILKGWPESSRDARYERLLGRWRLDYDRRPAEAAEAYARALVEFPHDWKSHYGLARAYQAMRKEAEARAEAAAVSRLRERLAPSPLAARLTEDLGKLDDPRSCRDLASLCEGVGLTWLAEAWTRQAEARQPDQAPSPGNP